MLFFSTIVPAQTLPSLPVDSRIQKGSLACGVRYYMVTNKSAKGYADIAIIQRDTPLSSASMEQLDPAFLSRMGVAPGEDGYVSDVDGSTVYHFRDVPFYRTEVLDSMLLYSFARVAHSKAEQAVVVSGDIDPVELKKKMDIFSMLVPKMLVKENHRPDYVWEPSPAPWVETYPSSSPVAEVSVTYAGARVPFDYMNTAQAIVSDLFGDELQAILRHRLSRNLRDAGIPYGNIGFRSLRSMDYGGDERYTVTVSVAKEQADEAMRIISTTLAEIDAWGASAREFKDAKKVLTAQLRGRAASTPSLSDDIRRCVANFLYGAHLAPYSESMRLFARKTLADTTETRFFNQFADALLGQLENLTLEFTGAPDSLDKDQALFNYNLAYLYGSVIKNDKTYDWHSADSSRLDVSAPKVKIKSEKIEPVTGGTLWTFSNGMRVVFKRVSGSGVFHFALQLNGGLNQIANLKEGEGGYMGDLLSLYDVAGIPANAFRDLLNAGGVRMETELSVHSFSLKGEAPSGQLEFLLKSLLGMANNRKLNVNEFNHYSQNQALAQPSVTDLLYQRLVPGFVYTSNKLPGKLTADTPAKAHKYYNDRFAHMQDGVLILSGDLKEEEVKPLLLRYLGGFRTDKEGASRKPVTMKPLSGTVTSTIQGQPRGLYVLMDAEYALTSDHYYTSLVAARALQQTLVRSLAPYGYKVQINTHFFAQPQERFQIEIHCLPAGNPSENVEDLLPVLRKAIEASAEESVNPVDLKAWKDRLLADVKLELSSPSGFVSTLLDRYANNKDIASRYEESITAINAAKVQEYLGAMANGGRIEFVSE
jgi:predicted Zn-dependent peptidase